MRKLALVLASTLLARGDDVERRSYDISDLAVDDPWWPVAMAHVRAAAGGAEARLEGSSLVLAAPAAVQQRVAEALREVREGRGVAVTIEVHFARLKDGAGAAAVPAGKLDLFLKERSDRIGGQTISCLNLQRVTAEIARDVAYVSDFDIEVGTGDVTIGLPTIEVAKETWTARLRPQVAGKAVRVATEFTITGIGRPIPEFRTLLSRTPARIQLPESGTRTASRTVECAPDTFTVVDLGNSEVALLRATATPKER